MALMGRAAFAAYKRFGRRPKPWRRGGFADPEHSDTEGWSRPVGGGTQNKKDILPDVLLFWSGIRESNPPPQLGKLMYYRYTNPAQI